MDDLVSVALRQVGYKESSGNRTKYGEWIGSQGQPWCHSFVSWCANYAGIGTDIVPRTASTTVGMNFYLAKGRFKHRTSGYVPKRNDIIYFKSNGASHVGIVTSTKGDIVYTVEGNSSDEVRQRQYSMSKFTQISGYGIVSAYIKSSGGYDDKVQGTVVSAKFTAYYPDNSAMEGGYYAANGEKLNPNLNTCAAPKSIAFGSNIRVANTGTELDGRVYRVNDRGGAIIVDSSGVYHIDILMANRSQANAFGVHYGTAIIGVPSSNNGTVEGIHTNNSPAYSGIETVSTEDSTKAKTEIEKKYLNKVLSAHADALAETRTPTEFNVASVDTSHKVELKVMVSRGSKSYVFPVLDGAKIIWQRKNAPGKFTFQTVYSEKYQINNGDFVNVYLNDKLCFYGFVFSVKRNKGGDSLSVTAYDQLRYLKNKDTYIYTKWTATKLIEAIAKDCNLQVGTLQNTKKKYSRIDDNQTYMDIIQNNLDETLLDTGMIYTLYDDCGKLMLKKPSSMKVKALICAQTAQDFSYNKSIDSNVYNQIKIGVENPSTGILEMYVTKDTKNINKWGLLQYYDTAADAELAKLKGKAMLILYDTESKTLSVEGVWGNINVRAGCLIPTVLDIGDTTLSQYMLVDRVTHEFSNHEHTMNIDLAGGGFDSNQ